MANYGDKKQSSKKAVSETLTLYKDYSKKRDTWAEKAKQDKEFRLGKQWTKEQEDTLNARGQAPIVVNRIHPAVETAKARFYSGAKSQDGTEGEGPGQGQGGGRGQGKGKAGGSSIIAG